MSKCYLIISLKKIICYHHVVILNLVLMLHHHLNDLADSKNELILTYNVNQSYITILHNRIH